MHAYAIVATSRGEVALGGRVMLACCFLKHVLAAVYIYIYTEVSIMPVLIVEVQGDVRETSQYITLLDIFCPSNDYAAAGMHQARRNPSQAPPTSA